MTVKTEPFISGKYGWDFGEGGWNVGADENWLKLSYLLSGKITAIEPDDTNAGSYADGTAYWNTSDQTINPKVNGTTRKYTLPRGFNLTSTDGSIKYEYNGSALVPSMTTADKVRLDGILVNPAINDGIFLSAAGGGVPVVHIDKVGGSPLSGGAISFTAVGGSASISQAGPDLEISSDGIVKILNEGSFAGSVTFAGSGSRLKADLSNATITDRTMFQSTATNNSSSLGILPNGTAMTAQFTAYNNSNPTNASAGRFGVNATEVTLESILTGSGGYLPLKVNVGGATAITVATSGNVGIGTVVPASKLSVLGSASISGDVYVGTPSLVGNGYCPLTNGMLLQWGTYTTNGSGALVAASFPLAFPNACLSVAGTVKSTTALESVSAIATSTSQFTLQTRTASTGAGVAATVTIIAIGY